MLSLENRHNVIYEFFDGRNSFQTWLSDLYDKTVVFQQ